MLGHVRCELYKLILNPVYRISILVCVLSTLAFGIFANDTLSESFIEQAIPLVEILFILKFLIIGSIWCAEYSNHAIRDSLIVKESRTQLFLAKYICTLGAIVIIYFLQILMLYLVNIGNYSSNEIMRLMQTMILQGGLALVLTAFLILMAIVLQKYSYFTAFMIILYLCFRWLLATPNFNMLSYLELQYRNILSFSLTDEKLLSDAIHFIFLVSPVSFILGFIKFTRQEF